MTLNNQSVKFVHNNIIVTLHLPNGTDFDFRNLGQFVLESKDFRIFGKMSYLPTGPFAIELNRQPTESEQTAINDAFGDHIDTVIEGFYNSLTLDSVEVSEAKPIALSK